VLATLRDIERLPNMTIVSVVNIRAGDLSPDGPTVISLDMKGKIAFTPEGL